METIRFPAADALVRTDPNTSVPALEKGANEVVHQSRFGRVMKKLLPDLAIDASPFGSYPKSTVAVPEEVANSDPLHTREIERFGIAIA